MMVEIPDGNRTPIWFNANLIIAVREHNHNPDKTFIWLQGVAEDGWLVECKVADVLARIPK